MSLPFIMVLAMGVLFACGVYLMLERSLTRVLLGFILLGNAVNLLIVLFINSYVGYICSDCTASFCTFDHR